MTDTAGPAIACLSANRAAVISLQVDSRTQKLLTTESLSKLIQYKAFLKDSITVQRTKTKTEHFLTVHSLAAKLRQHAWFNANDDVNWGFLKENHRMHKAYYDDASSVIKQVIYSRTFVSQSCADPKGGGGRGSGPPPPGI